MHLATSVLLEVIQTIMFGLLCKEQHLVKPCLTLVRYQVTERHVWTFLPDVRGALSWRFNGSV